MNRYFVLFYISSDLFTAFKYKECFTENTENAETQVLNECPNADIVWVYQASEDETVENALNDYDTAWQYENI
jgi:hypothetical protein